MIIALVTYNRLDYTKKTLKHLKATLQVPAYIIVVDNNSTDGTQEYLKKRVKSYLIDEILLNPDNYYPGKATNLAWEQALKSCPDATHLMRLDNDMLLKMNWDITAEAYFKDIPELGQLGIDHEAIEHPKAPLREIKVGGHTVNPWPGCVGGPNIIRRKIWNDGIRYPELRWDDGRNSPLQEDSQFSKLIKAQGWMVGHMTEDLARTFANEENWNEDIDYYLKTMYDRGYGENVKKLEQFKANMAKKEEETNNG